MIREYASKEETALRHCKHNGARRHIPSLYNGMHYTRQKENYIRMNHWDVFPFFFSLKFITKVKVNGQKLGWNINYIVSMSVGHWKSSGLVNIDNECNQVI